MTPAGEALRDLWLRHHDSVVAYEEVKPIVDAYTRTSGEGIKFIIDHPEVTAEDVREAMEYMAERYGPDDPFVRRMVAASEVAEAARAEENADNN